MAGNAFAASSLAASSSYCSKDSMAASISLFTLVRPTRIAPCVRSSPVAVAETPVFSVEMPRLKSIYVNKVVPALKEILSVEKVVVNCGIGEGSQNAMVLEAAMKDISTLTRQRSNITPVKKAIAGFKILKGVPFGIKVTLRREDYTDIDAGKGKLICPVFKVKRPQRWCSDAFLPAIFSFPVLLLPDCARAEVFSRHINLIYGDLGAGSEASVQVLYLAALLCLVGVASYFVVKQVLNRRDLEAAARDLQDRVRTGEAMPVEYFELGAVMLRKKFYVLASRYLEQAIAKWDGDQQDLAQVHNALGYSYVNDEQIDRGIAEYQKAVKLQPGYVIAWNNLGSAFEKKKNYPKALEAYEKALLFDPNNAVAKEYRDDLKKRVDRLEGVPVKYD